jgi:acyl carrier protein
VAQGARRLILLGRAALPPRLQWQAVESSSRLGQQIAAIQEIEAMGASVHLAAVDVADEAQLAAFLATYRQEGWPPIRGVVHMAGVVEPELLRQLEVDSLKAVLRPKVVGSWLLHCLLQDAPLDFFVLFSSAAALLNSPLLGSYAAANAFLDALAHYRRAEGRPALSINWGYWSEAGMAARYQQEMGRELTPKGMAAFTPAQGLAALGQLLRQNATQVGVMPVDWQAWSRFHPAAGHSPLLSDLVARDAWPATNGEYTATANGHFPAVSLPQAEPGEDGVTRLAAYLRRFIAQVLYIEEARLPADGNLMELGMDSLMAMELIRGVERDLHLRLYPREILERPSIGALAQYLATEMDRARPEAKDSAATSAAAAAEVAALSFASGRARSISVARYWASAPMDGRSNISRG